MGGGPFLSQVVRPERTSCTVGAVLRFVEGISAFVVNRGDEQRERTG